jgi:predicted kinase
VGFLAMELDARSRPDLAAGFLAGFAMESDDYDLYAVVDFYLCYRAWVRAKVACFLAADPSTDPDKARRKALEGQRLFGLARAYVEAPPTGQPLIAVGGVIGAGKSTLAEALGRALGVPVIASDRTRKALAGVPATQPAPPAAYAPAFSARTFAELFRRAEVVLRSGRGVVLDATFREREVRLQAQQLARRHQRPFRFVEASCDETTLRQRLRRRATGLSVSDATEDLLDRIRREFEPITEFSRAEHVTVPTTQPVEAQVEAVRASLG